VTVTPSWTQTFSYTETPVPEPYHVVLSLYNSAGEKVKSLYSGSSQSRPISLGISYLPFTGGQIPVSVQIEGIASINAPPPITWLGDNDGGQPVQNGMYYFKMETTDPFGAVTAYSKEVTVMGNTGGNSLAVYNSAGELVKNIPLKNYPNDLADFEISGQSGASSGTMAGGFDPATGQPRGELKLELKDTHGASHAFSWDGTNDQGAPVASGVYTVKLVKTQLGSSVIVKAKSVTVINAQGSPAQNSAASAVLGPNPLMGEAARSSHAAFAVKFLPSLSGEAHARLYNLAGELITQSSATASQGRLSLPAAGLAGGIYLVEFDIREGNAVLGRKAIKAVIIK
jgi:flagellar hook assembly protein FlgD